MAAKRKQATNADSGARRVRAAAAGAAEPPRNERTDILVKATDDGYYNLKRFREGDTFFLNKEEDFSERWMVAVDANREEVEEETERLTKISTAARRLAAAERAADRATFAAEIDPQTEREKAEADLEEARKAKRVQGARKPSPDAQLGEGDPKRKLAGSDFETHEDVHPGDAKSGPNGARASDQQVA